jgi:hypothetical protein
MKILGIGSRIKHAEYGLGVVMNVTSTYYNITFYNQGSDKVDLEEPLEIIEFVAPEKDMVSFFDVEQSLKKILEKWNGQTETVPLGDKWKGGTMILKPAAYGMSTKEMPIETFFDKIVMMRDKLRVLEQKVNSSNLDDEAKVDCQQYITRCYGSMTSFNILFKESSQQFSTK